jgi:hypothetical protein
MEETISVDFESMNVNELRKHLRANGHPFNYQHWLNWCDKVALIAVASGIDPAIAENDWRARKAAKESAKQNGESSAVVSTPRPTPVKQAVEVATDDKVAKLRELLGLDTTPVDRETVQLIVREEMENARVVKHEYTLTTGDSTVKIEGRQHKRFDDLVAIAKYSKNIFLVGPAGSGKSTAAEKLAELFGLKFYSSGAITQAYDLLGFKNAMGELQRTDFREAYEHGGVFLLDEMDASNPNALVKFNQATANGVCAFPDGMIKRHAKCIIIGAGNTYGYGADAQFCGRNPLDGASLDRFSYLTWDYDEEFEEEIAGHAKWCDYVRKVRREVSSRGFKVCVTPRASINGARGLQSGAPAALVVDAELRKGFKPDQWQAIVTAVGHFHN